jgi:DNA-directed RNA polymerase II subunit RPB2
MPPRKKVKIQEPPAVVVMQSEPESAKLPDPPTVVNENVEFLKADAYRIMRSKFIHDGFARPHLESFSDFVNVKIPSCLSEHAPVVVVHEPSDTEHIVEIQGVRYDRPSVREPTGMQRGVTPHECHLRRLTYQFNMLITARYMIRCRSTGRIMHSVIFRDKQFDHIPCMKLSEFCTSQVDPESMMEDESECGGYFISSGAEKVVVGQEAPRNNYAFVMEDSDGVYKCECRSFNESKYRSTSTLYILLNPPYDTKSMEERQTCTVRITIRIPFVSDPLPLPVTFKLLGVTNIEAMYDYICQPTDAEWFKKRVMDALLYNMEAVVMTREFAYTRLAHDRGQMYTGPRRRKTGGQSGSAAATAAAAAEEGRKRKKRAETETEEERCQKQVAGLISTEFLPHQGYNPESVDAKLVLFGLSVRKLLRVYYGLQEVDDRDHYMHRRVQLTSSLMTLLFRKHFTMWRRRMASQIRRDLDNGSQFVNIKQLLQANIGGNLQTALSTGNFSMQRGQNNMDGVGQVLNRTEPNAPESHVNRTSNPMNKDGRAIAPRLQNESGIGIIDPWETPEGQACGLMRNMSPMAGVRVGYPNEILIDAVMSTGMVDAAGKNVPLAQQRGCQVYVSGVIIGICELDRVDPLLKLLRARRAAQDIPFDVSIYKTTGTWATTEVGEVHINGDAGSYWWPLIRVDRMSQLRYVLDHVTNEDDLWSTLLSEGIIEVINKDEEATSVRVALYHQQLESSPPDTYTHVVIHPSQICSVFTARGPLLEFNQAPRVTYQAGMGKQAIGRELTNSKFRADTATHTLWYPAKPLVGTLMDDVLNPDGVASLQNPVVCILANGGYNIEDSLIFKKSSIQRGLFRSTVTRSVRDVVRTVENEREELAVPPEGCRSRLNADYASINPETGVVNPGAQVHGNSVLISKMAHMTHKRKVDVNGEEQEVEIDKVRDRSTTSKTRETSIVDDVILSTTLENEISVRVKTRSMRVPEVGDKFCCLTDDHDVLTTAGWVPIAQVTTDMHVACLQADLSVVYEQPTRVWHYDSAPKVAVFANGQEFCQTVTLNHRLPLWINNQVELVCTESAIFEHGVLEHVVAAQAGFLGKPVPALEAWLQTQSVNRAFLLQLLGFMHHYVWFDRSTNLFYTSHAAIMDFVVEEIFKCCQIPFVRIENGYQFNVPNVLDYPDVFDITLIQQSTLPAWCLHLNADDASRFLQGATLRSNVMPSHHADRDIMMALAVHAGARVQSRYDTLYMDFSNVKTVITKAQHVSILHWNKPVYCLTVPATEIFCVRHHGVVSWTGNSRYGQKGTIGAVYDDVDMPFCPGTGITPDIIINPHALPSRMTIGHLIEKLMGKLAALSGELADGTPFSQSEDLQDSDDPDVVINYITRELEKYGFQGDGMETMCDGRTGRNMQMKVFVGPMSYQKLRHMVQDKYHARSRGPVQMQTGQPVEGRHRDGGQRFGEMERDNLLGHGASNLLLERLLVSSDQASVPVCTTCGLIAQPAKRNAGHGLFAASVHAEKPFCATCLSHETVRMCEMPFAYKLSTQEIQALHLRAGFCFEPM